MPVAKKERQNTKRTKCDSSKTLDHFFKKSGPTPNKGQGNPPIPGSALKPRPRNEPPTSSPQIIIIDSDDETEVQVTRIGTKKRKLNEDSDVEVVDLGPLPIKCASAAATSLKRRSISDSVLKSPSGAAVTSTSASATFAFGTPSLLSSDFQSPPLTFGTAGGLLDSTIPTSGTALSSGSSVIKEETSVVDAGAESVKNAHIDVDSSENASDEWLMGGGEIGGTYAGREDDEDEVEFVENTLMGDSESEVGINFCPCCEQQLRGLQPYEVQNHINSCLDSRGKGKGKASVFPELTKCSTRSLAGNNVFSVLMSSNKENETWKEATAVENESFQAAKADGGRRKAPFYKVLQGMPIAVDAFRYGTIPGITAYFLTHAHSDHYTNLSSSWKSGPIYCSQGTANLVIHMLSVDKKWVRPLPMNIPTTIPDTGGVQVTLIEANHCPGSCLFLFEGQQTVNAGDSNFLSPFVGSSRMFRYLHCGDFRASPRHVMHPAVKRQKIDHVYLDTTYLDPRYTFPAQPLVISACAELARRAVAGEPTTTNKSMKSWLPSLSSIKPVKEPGNGGRVLLVIGTYSIGKERIVKAVAQTLNSKIYCDARKTALLRCEGDAELEALLTSDPLEATVHLMPLGTIATDRLKIYMDRFKGVFTRVIGFRPTGWTFSQPGGTDQMPSIVSILSRTSQKDFTYADLRQSPKSTSSIQVYGVPYSEHSSFYELTCFAMSFSWIKMIATVNVGSERSRGKMAKWVEKWETERKKRSVDTAVAPRHEDYW